MGCLGSVKIGIHQIVVYEVPQPVVNATDVDGMFSAADHIIHIKAGMPVSRQRMVLMHELLHLAHTHSGLDDGKKHGEEQTCERLADALTEIINRNQWITDFIMDGRK